MPHNEAFHQRTNKLLNEPPIGRAPRDIPLMADDKLDKLLQEKGVKYED